MATPGPKPKPTETKRRRGNPGRRPLNDREPKPPSGAPEMPSVLKGLAAETWTWLCDELDGMGTLRTSDVAIMMVYCRNFAKTTEMYGLVDEKGVFAISEKESRDGTVKETVYLSGFSQGEAMYEKRLKAAAVELGLSPSARPRLQGPQEGDDDPLLELLQRRLRRQAGSQN